MQTFYLLLLAFTPITIVGSELGFPPTALFFLAAAAIVPLARFIGQATEELSGRSGPAVGGLLNATFGNAPELLIGTFAIRQGLIDVVKASITGSLIGNLLLVLGTAIFAGGARYKTLSFNRSGAQASASTLLLAVIAMTVPALFFQTSPSMRQPAMTDTLSLFVSVLMITSYLASLWFALRTHAHLYIIETAAHEAKWSIRKGIIILLLATIATAWVSEVLAASIEPAAHRLGLTQLFIGVVVIALVGNVAEHTSAIVVAAKNQMDLTLQISIGSATQIAMFVAPALVLISVFLAKPMNLVFNSFELLAIILSVLIVNQVVGDGESNWFEGLQLLLAYGIIAAALFLHA
jgi:Ca2+:H+ antiporter